MLPIKIIYFSFVYFGRLRVELHLDRSNYIDTDSIPLSDVHHLQCYQRLERSEWFFGRTITQIDSFDLVTGLFSFVFPNTRPSLSVCPRPRKQTTISVKINKRKRLGGSFRIRALFGPSGLYFQVSFESVRSITRRRR